MADKSTPSEGQSVAILYSDKAGDEMVGTIRTVNDKQGLSMVLWPDNPIEDWIENASLAWNGAKNRWETNPEG